MVWRRWFETATYMIDGVFDHLPVTAAVHDGLGGDFLLLDFDEVTGHRLYRVPHWCHLHPGSRSGRGVYFVADRLCAAALSESDSADVIVARIETLKTSSED